MLLDFIPQITYLIFLLALVGYVAKYFYNLGYYQDAYNPQSQNSLEKMLNNSSFGMILIIFGIIFFAFSFGADNSIIPDSMKNISISSETYENGMIYSALLALFTVFIVYISAFSIFIGFSMSYGSAKSVVLKTNDVNNPNLCVREIYAENDIFLYYLTLEGKWGAIRRSSVQSMDETKADSRLDTWLKDGKNNRYYLIAALVVYVAFVLIYNVWK